MDTIFLEFPNRNGITDKGAKGEKKWAEGEEEEAEDENRKEKEIVEREKSENIHCSLLMLMEMYPMSILLLSPTLVAQNKHL